MPKGLVMGCKPRWVGILHQSLIQTGYAAASLKIMEASFGVFVGGHLIAVSLPLVVTTATLVQLAAAFVHFLRPKQGRQSQ